MKERINFYDYACNKLGFKLKTFDDGHAWKEEWDLIIDILAKTDDYDEE